MALGVLLVNEAATAALRGPAAAGKSLRAAFEEAADVDLVVEDLPPTEGWRAVATRPVPLVGRYDLDLQQLRWHLVHGAEVRRRVAALEQRTSFEVAVVNTHTMGLLLGSFMARVPTLLEVDLTMRQHHGFAAWREWRPWTGAVLAPSVALERRRFAQAAAVVAQSRWVADAVRRVQPAARIEVINPGLDLERFRPAVRAPRERLRVLFVGGRFEAKGGLDLLAALGDRLGRDVELDVVTADPVPPSPGVRVHRLDPGPTLTSLFQQADLFALPSHADGNPFVVLEAQACGTPVVASDVGGIPELVGESGRVVGVHDRRALARALDELLHDPAGLAGRGVAARRHVEERFDARRQGALLVDLARSVAC